MSLLKKSFCPKKKKNILNIDFFIIFLLGVTDFIYECFGLRLTLFYLYFNWSSAMSTQHLHLIFRLYLIGYKKKKTPKQKAKNQK